MSLYADGLIEWNGQPGGMIYYKQPDGSWKPVGAPEHWESASYVERAVNDPQVAKLLALYDANPAYLNNEQNAFINGGMGMLDSFGQGYRWGYQNLFDNVFDPQQAGYLLQTGYSKYLSPSDIAAGQQFNYDQSPAQQAARSDSGGFFDDIAPLLLAGAGLYFGLPELSGLLDTAAAGEVGGLYGLESGGAGVGAADLGAGYGAAAAGTGATAAGTAGTGGNMAFDALDPSTWGDLLSSPSGSTSFVPPTSTGSYPWLDAAGNLDVDKFLQMTAAGGDAASVIPGGAQGVAGMDTLGSTSYLQSLMNTLTSQGISPSTAANLVSKLFSSGSGSSGLGSLLSGDSGGISGNTLGSLLAAGLGAYASNKQTDALTAQADKYSAMGQPYRDKLAELYADPSSFLSSPGVKASVDQGTNALMRSLSTQGNPFGSGNALQQGQTYATNSLWGQLDTEKKNLANFGGLSSFNATAPGASTTAINSGSNTYNALGAGINNIFNPPETTAQTIAKYNSLMGRAA